MREHLTRLWKHKTYRTANTLVDLSCSYPYKELQSLVSGQQLFVEFNGLHMTTAELRIHLQHFVRALTWELTDTQRQCTVNILLLETWKLSASHSHTLGENDTSISFCHLFFLFDFSLPLHHDIKPFSFKTMYLQWNSFIFSRCVVKSNFKNTFKTDPFHLLHYCIINCLFFTWMH